MVVMVLIGKKPSLENHNKTKKERRVGPGSGGWVGLCGGEDTKLICIKLLQ